MQKVALHQVLDAKWEDGTRPKDLYKNHIAGSPEEYVQDIIDGLGADVRKVQNGCAELASLLSEDQPALVYPHLDLFAANLKAKEPILRWEAACTLGNLSTVDERRALPDSIAWISRNLDHKSIVLQGHSVRALAKIGGAYPEHAPGILASLTGAAEHFPRNRIGFIVEAMEYLLVHQALLTDIEAFVRPLSDSPIKVVARKANKILNKLPAGR